MHPPFSKELRTKRPAKVVLVKPGARAPEIKDRKRLFFQFPLHSGPAQTFLCMSSVPLLGGKKMSAQNSPNWYEKWMAQLSRSQEKAEFLEFLVERIQVELEMEYFLIDLIMEQLWEEPPG